MIIMRFTGSLFRLGQVAVGAARRTFGHRRVVRPFLGDFLGSREEVWLGSCGTCERAGTMVVLSGPPGAASPLCCGLAECTQTRAYLLCL